ncbi:MAG: pilus assembly protein PilM [Candidatus Paceibacterota bacterium]|jgi:type IV pilus assembly protein PilM
MASFVKSFLRFFPTPQFLAMPAVGLDVSDRAIRFVEFGRRSGLPVLKNFGEIILPEGLVVGGEIKKPKELSEILTQVKARTGLKFARVALPEEKAYLFRTVIPKVEAKEVRSLLEFKLEENVPLSPAEVIFDYEIIPSRGPKSGNELEISVSAIPRQFVVDFSNVLGLAGLTPISFEVEARAFVRTLLKKNDSRATIIVFFKETKTVLAVAIGNLIYFTSTLSISGEMLTKTLANTLKIAPEVARRLKAEKGLAGYKENLDVFASLTTVLAALKDEISRIMIYWNSHEKIHNRVEQDISRVVFCGQDSAIPGFDVYMRAALGVEVAVGNVWLNAFDFDDCIPDISQSESLNYATAIGLALPKEL